jgi:hypothetical protein
MQNCGWRMDAGNLAEGCIDSLALTGIERDQVPNCAGLQREHECSDVQGPAPIGLKEL